MHNPASVFGWRSLVVFLFPCGLSAWAFEPTFLYLSALYMLFVEEVGFLRLDSICTRGVELDALRYGKANRHEWLFSAG